MKIAHLCLSNYYSDGYSYQENELVRQNVDDGHEVIVIASTETYVNNGHFDVVKSGKYLGGDGAEVIRLPYSFNDFFPYFILRKIRAHKGLYKLLSDIKPDVILFHGMCGWDILTVSRYKKNNKEVVFFVDQHTDFNNSAKNLFSKYILHSLIYKNIVRFSLKYIDKILCISYDCLEFARVFYEIPKEMLEFYPLGGDVVDSANYNLYRQEIRGKFNLKEEVVFVQSGKFTERKKIIESLQEFIKIKNENLRFILIGSFSEEIKNKAEKLINSDRRIIYLGWQTPNFLQKALCAADFYIQPGTQSATMQMALCCRAAVILDDVKSHVPYFKSNGWLLNEENSLGEVLHQASFIDKQKLEVMKKNSHSIAKEILDYKNLAKRLYS